MFRKTSLCLAILCGFLTITGCTSFFNTTSAITGSEIYSITATQDAGNAAHFTISVTIDAAKKAALASSLGSSYKEPENLYIWLAPVPQTGAGQAFEFLPLVTVSLLGKTDSFTTEINLLDLQRDGYMGVPWLNADYFTMGSQDFMAGLYIFASDGWSYTSSASSSQSHELSGQPGVFFSFPDRFPMGQGVSNCYGTTSFEPILSLTGWSTDYAGGTMSLAASMTLSYYSDSQLEDPKLNVSSYAVNPVTSAVWDPAISKYVWTFKLRFSAYNYPDNWALSYDGDYTVVPVEGSFSIYGENSAISCHYSYAVAN